MLTRTHRFHGHTSLNYVYRHGATVRGHQVVVRFVRNSKQTDYRVAVIVSRKVHKSAVARNRVRRRIYEIVRTGRPITIPHDIVITVFSEQIITMPPAELQELIYSLLTKAGVYRSSQPAPTSRVIVDKREERV